MESPGKFLKKERETRNISLEAVSYFTKIKEGHLKAIEEDRYELLPPALYVKGYLSVYAKYLNLNPKDIISQYENYLKSLIPPVPIEFEKKLIPRRKRIRIWLPLLSIFFVAALFTILFISHPLHYPAEKKTKTISLPLTSPPPVSGQAMKIQPIQSPADRSL